MRALFFLVAATAVGTASADTHVGNGEVHDTFGVADPIQGHGEAHGGSTAGGVGSTSPPEQIAPACPEEPDGVNDPRRGKPLCGQPPAPQCDAPAGAVCSMMMPAPRTYPNCASLIRHRATLVHFGPCEGQPRPEPEPQRIAIGFEVKNFHQCVARVSHAKRLKPALAPWIQADGKPMKTREFCKRLFNPPVVEPQNGEHDTSDDDAEETAVGE